MNTREKIKKLKEEFSFLYPKSAEKNYLRVYDYLERGKISPILPAYIGIPFQPEDQEKIRGDTKKAWEPEIYAKIEEGLNNLVTVMKKGDVFSPLLPTSYGVNDVPSVFVDIVFSQDSPGGYPERNLSCEEILDYNEKECVSRGFVAKIKNDIEIMKELLPKKIKISLPDLQGPLNIAHTLLGTDIFLLIKEHPEKISQVLKKISRVWILIHKNLVETIGERIHTAPDSFYRVAECSCNLISKKTYREIVKPADRIIADYLGKIAFHTCSGRHVFEVTLEEFPETVYTEAGISMSFAPCTLLDDALAKIRELKRDVILSTGQELKEKGKEAETIKNYLRKIEAYPKLMFGFSVMHWSNKDSDLLENLKNEIFDFYQQEILKKPNPVNKGGKNA